MRRLLVFFLLCVSIFSNANDKFRFKKYSMEDGLPDNLITCIMQDKDGYIWFGTSYGVALFDGHKIKSFEAHENGLGRINNLAIMCLFQASNGSIWIGTSNGIFRYSPYTSELVEIEIEKVNGSFSNEKVSTSIIEDANARIWMTTSQGVFMYQPSKDSIKHVKCLNTNSKMVKVYTKKLFFDSRHQLWLGTRSGIFLLNKQEEAFRRFHIPEEEDWFKNINIVCFKEDSQGDLWAGTRQSGLVRIRDKEIKRFFTKEHEYFTQNIHEVVEYELGKLLVSSDCGLVEMNLSDNSYQVYLPDDSEYSINERFLYGMCIDNHGGLWIGSFTRGVNFHSPYFKRFSTFVNKNGGKVLNTMIEDDIGNLWIASDDGGVAYFDIKKGKFAQRADKVNKLISHHNVHSLLLDNDKLWVGTYTGGLNIVDLKKNKVEVIKQFHALHNVYALCKDVTNNVWLGSLNGLIHYSREENKYTPVESFPNETAVIDIEQDKFGTLWVATFGKGLWYKEGQGKTWKKFSDKDNLIPDRLHSIHVTDEYVYVGGYKSGLFCFQLKLGKVSEVAVDYFKDKTIQSILTKGDYCWVSTDNGLFRYNIISEQVIRFSQDQGLQGEQYHNNSAILTSKGELFWGGSQGLSRLNEKNLIINQTPDKVKLTRLVINYKDVSPAMEGSPLEKNLLYTKELSLKYDQNYFGIGFSSFNNTAPSNIRYLHKLEGVDNGWIESNSDHVATYTKLSPGEYEFKVKASNIDGFWSEDHTSLTIRIAPPFVKSTGAKILWGLLILGVIAIFLKWIQIISRNKTERIKVQHDKEIYESKLQFLTSIAHEIRTPLSLIIGPLESILKSTKIKDDEINEDLHVMERNCERMLQLVNELLDFRKVESNAYSISMGEADVSDILVGVYDRFKQSAKMNGVDLDIDISPGDYSLETDVGAAVKIFSNIINNGLKFTKTKLSISLITNTDGQFEVRVMDDGEGISKDEIDRIFEPFYQAKNNKSALGTGLGLPLVKSLTALLGWKMSIESKEGKGSAILFHITPKHGTSIKDVKESEQGDDDLLQILLIDDHPEIVNFLSRQLEGNYKVIPAYSAEEGLSYLEKEGVDLILTDVMMEEMSGIDLCKAVKTDVRFSHIPVIVMTANTSDASKLKSLEYGADAFIQKPLRIEFLLAQIENVFKNRRTEIVEFLKSTSISRNDLQGSLDVDFCRRLNELISDNLSNSELSIDILSQTLGMGRTTLFNKIKALYAMSPMDYVRVFRLKKSAELLIIGEYRVNEIAYLVGFNTPSYFSKCFKKQFGCLPGDYKKSKIEEG
ncbi:MAG: response regulator [Bacteroidales bacterium]|nr:response regulator [Bacteroidales bacterium]